MDPYKTRKVAKVIAFIIVIAMLITSFSFVLYLPGLFGSQGVVYAASSDENLDNQLQELKDYIEYIKKNYKDDITYKELIDGAFEGVAYALNDPYSIYYGATGEGEAFVETVTGEYSGVGLSLENYDGKCRVVSPIPGTPAEKSGIKAGDVITKIDSKDISGKPLDEAAKMMRGAEGTKVTITVDRGGQVLNFTLTRAKIKNVSVHDKQLDNKIGYIQITSFDNDSNQEFAAALAGLEKQGIESLVIDIRNNPGGLVNVALDIANQLMPKGAITHFERQGEVIESYSADGTSDFDLPLVLLVNEGSASASEILAGALQDSKTATLVGTNTYGKGVAQQVVSFEDGSELKLSMFYFMTPNKHKIDHVGITPDYTIQNAANSDGEKLAKEYQTFAPMSEKVKPSLGSVGLNVFGAQQRLKMLGYSVNPTGTMDEGTVSAVKKFQQERGLYAYGTLDYSTMAAIDKAVISYINGTQGDKDLALDKAVELLKQEERS